MKISVRMMKGIVVLIGALFVFVPLTAFAANKVVVIPLFDSSCTSGTCKPLKNIVTVAKANGMFTDPVAAVNSITNASETNPYLVVIGPGVYTVTTPVVMKEWVDITGSGENVTKITGAISTEEPSTSAIIRGANYSALSFLTVENTGGGSVYSVALHNDHASPGVSHVTSTAIGGTYNIGVYNYASLALLTNLTAEATGGTNNYGVCNVYSPSPVMTNVTATATGGTYSYGIYNNSSSSSSPVMTNVTATATGGTYSYGVRNYYSSSVIRRSSMEGDSDGLNTSGTGTATISQSTIINGIGGTGAKNCVACDKGDGTVTNSSCE